MYRHPLLDLYLGTMIALGGPMAMMLPQRIFLAMLQEMPAFAKMGVPAPRKGVTDW